MNKKIWIPLALCSAAGAFTGIWRLIHLQETPPVAQGRASSDQIFTGKLEPVISVVVPANQLKLEVPLYSLVLRGQVIGEGLSWRKRREVVQAEPPTPDPRDGVLEKDEAALVNAETWEQQAESHLATVTLRYREHVAGALEEDAAVTERERADAALANARHSLEHDLASLSPPARIRQRVETAGVGWGPVLAPIDGLLVPASADGRVGIAADPAALCVRTIVDEIDSVRVSQKARVKIDATGAEIDAKVTEIDVVPTTSGGRSGYAVTLSLQSAPSTLPPGDAGVHVYLASLP